MSSLSNAEVVRLYTEAGWNHKSVAAFESLLASDFVNHDPNNPTVTDRESLIAFAQEIWRAFPDFSVMLGDWIESEDHIAALWVAQGTHTGDWRGVAPTGRLIQFEGINMHTLATGKLVGIHWSYDMLGVLRQLGTNLATLPLLD